MNIHYHKYERLLEELNIVKVFMDNHYMPHNHLNKILEDFSKKVNSFPLDMLPILYKDGEGGISLSIDDALENMYKTYSGDTIYFSATRYKGSYNEDSFTIIITNKELKKTLDPIIRKIKMALKKSNAQKKIDGELYSESLVGSYKIARDLLLEVESQFDLFLTHRYSLSSHVKISKSVSTNSNKVLVYQEMNSYALLRVIADVENIKLTVFAENPDSDLLIKTRLSKVFEAIDKFEMAKSIAVLKGEPLNMEGLALEWKDETRRLTALNTI